MKDKIFTHFRQFQFYKVIVLFLGFNAFDASAVEYSQSYFSASLAGCGQVKVSFVLQIDDDGTTNDDFWDDGAQLQRKIGSGEFITIGKFGKGDDDNQTYIFSSTANEDAWYTPLEVQYVTYENIWDNDGNGLGWIHITTLPGSNALGQTITFRLVGDWEDGDEENNLNDVSATLPAFPNVENFAVTNNTECNGIQITWTPVTYCSPFIEIERTLNGITTELAPVEASQGQLLDLDVVPGENYSYRARYSGYYSVTQYLNGGSSTSDFTKTSNYTLNFSGMRKNTPSPPANFMVSNDNCDDKIILQWSPPSDADSIHLFRNDIKINSFSGNTTGFIDENVDVGLNYNYAVRGKNECGNGEFTQTLIGISPSDPEKPANLLATVIAGVGIELTWPDVALETGYIVERNLLGGGGASFFEVDQNITSYLDESIVECQTYEYRILSVNNCKPNGVVGDSLRRAKLIPDLSNTFNSTSFSGSKGFFSNRVELQWTVANNANFLNGFKIYRKQLGTEEDSVLIASTNSGSNIYIDNLADAGVLYEYTIIGETQCENNTVYSNPVKTVGFRSPFGTVTGNVTYTGGIAVKDVRISAESTSQILGNSVQFDGSGRIDVAHKNSLIPPTDSMLIEAWIRPTELDNDFTLVKKGESYRVDYDAINNQFTFDITYNGGNSATLIGEVPTLNLNNYHHVAFQIHKDSMQFFFNGDQVVSQFVDNEIALDANTENIEIGEFFSGQLDEVRLWHTSKNPELIARDYSRLMVGGESGLRVYLRMNESTGNFAYDVSRVGNVFNRNHGSFSGSVSWSEIIPTNAQLSIVAYTDEAGNYYMNVPYNGLGESFVLTPSYLIHQFSPSTRALYIGDGATIHNNIDFEDISSFTVTGAVFYRNSSCPAEGVQLAVDGNAVIIDGLPAQTDINGQFNIQVPIGEHFVQVTKPGHGFSVGRFPETGYYNFQDDLAGVNFEDSTLVKVVGRVVGGLREANKLPGLGHSINNIGVAKLEFVSQLGGGCAGDTIFTDPETGEYEVYLPPLKYIPTLDVVNDPTIDFGVLSLLDLSGTPVTQTVYDTTFTTTGDVIAVDSVKFHKRLDFIHRVQPIIVVKDRDGKNDFIGDTIYTYINPVTQDTIIRNLRTNPFRWPVLSKHDDDYLYRCLIKVFERYVNADNTALIDSVPTTDGTLQFNNALSHYPVTQIDLSEVNTPDSLKFLVYSFKPGLPNFLENTSIPDYSFTRVFELTLITGNNESIAWEPIPINEVPVGGDQKFRAIMLGAKTDGAQFITEGPQVPEYILRDPPGSGSFASREVSSVKKETSSWNWKLGSSAHAEDNIYLGAKFSVGIGVSTATEVENNVIAGFTATISGGNSGEQSVTTTNTQSWSTNSGTDVPGSGSDLYIGKSKNVQFGIAEHLSLVPEELCDQVECLGPAMGGFQFARKYGLSIVPGGYQTTFIYNQNQIIKYQIPTLKNLRDVIIQSNPKYTSNLPIGDPNYGKNNDDPVFGANVSTNTPDEAEFADMWGPSYNYAAQTLADSLTGDSVRFINNQIKQWENAIRLNEWEKVNINNTAIRDSLKQKELDELEKENQDMLGAYYALVAANGIGGATIAYGLVATPVPGTAFAGYAVFAVTTTTGILQAELFEEFERYQAAKERINEKYEQTEPANYSISGGNIFTSSMTHETGATYTNSIEYGMDAEFKLEVTGKVNNNGVGFEKSVGLNFSSGRDWSTETTEAESVTFTLDDPDQGDFMSVDVYPSLLGWGPIFKKKEGGQTACPYEGEEVTKYYQPGTSISASTLQVDKPTISGSPSILYNTPITEAAVFNLTLGNESEAGFPRNYTVQLVSSSNPFGAIARIDGQPSITVSIPAGTSVNKVLTIEKGPGSVYQYDSLLFIIYPPCQYEFGTSDNVEIADSVYVSASFIPTCTDVELVEPEAAWVANNFNNDTIGAAIAGYNINFFDLEKLLVEYKPSNESQWIGLETFWKDTTGLNDPNSLPIPTDQSFALYDWDISQLTDGYYDLRVRSQCALADKLSTTYSGIIDRINPHPFGTPSPADGILSPNDDLKIRFNEPVDLGALTSQNFDIRGVLNGTEQNHSTSLFFDGEDDYLEISGGASLQNRDFTIQFAVKRAGTGEEAIFTQGLDPNEQLFLGFNDANQLVFRINDQEVTSSTTFENNDWHYIGLSYSFENETAEMFLANEFTSGVINTGNNNIFPQYQGSGKIFIGKRGHSNPAFFHGNIHELRIWDRTLSFNEFSISMNRLMSGGEAGLLYNWRMDEAEGIIAEEHIRRRDATLFGPTWSVEPGGSAADFDGISNFIKVTSGDVVITPEMDFTLEFWFRGSGNNPGVLFSNGSGTNTSADSIHSWVLEKDAAGLLHLKNNGLDFLLSNNNYFDGSWHHLAIVLNRNANISAIIDGNPQLATPATPFKQLAGAAMYLGAHGYFTGNIETVESYFDGEIDEFRFWNSARQLEQINRDKRNRMMGNEPSLILYLPFENYEVDPTGIAILTESFDEQMDPEGHVVEENGTALTMETPTIKLQRPVEAIAFNFSVNNDEIIFTPTTSQEMIENVTLDVTVSGVKDLQGNVMASPATWIAYLDKNQVVWADDLLAFEKSVGDELNFSSEVVNQGGAAKAFTIQNLPGWLSASPSSGTIPPNSVMEIEFEVDPLVNIGDYVQDVQLLTDFNFPEKLTIDLKVRETEPDWVVDPSDFEYSMGIIGMLEIKDIISSDEEDMLAAFVDDEVRGSQHVEYIEAFDRYLVFMDVYSNTNFGDSLTFKIWDAASGVVYSEITPEFIVFQSNSLVGSALDPQIFSTDYEIEVEIPLDAGWNWISQYLLNADSTNFDVLLESINAATGDQINGQVEFANYLDGTGWVGPLENSGLKPEQLYKLYSADDDTLVMRGDIIDPTSRIVSLGTGWNWIGFISIRNQGITQALGNLTPAPGDQIKGRSQFAVYVNENLGWQGTLQTLVPGRGYMYHSAQNTSFTFPFAGMFKNAVSEPDGVIDERWVVDYASHPSNMTMIIQPGDSCERSAFDAGLLLAAFDKEGEVRGLSELIQVQDDPYSFLTLTGENGEILNLSWINRESGKVYDPNSTVDFEGNGHDGSINDPVIINLPNEFCKASNSPFSNSSFSVFPTLFNSHLTIVYTADREERTMIVLRDMSGREVFNQEIKVVNGLNQWDVNLPEGKLNAGAYTISLESANVRLVEKVFKIR